MTIKEALNEYQFNNVGQFKGIAQSLGYREEYNSGFLCFTLNGEEFRTTVHEIRSHTQTKFDETVKKDSMERICKFFDKDKTDEMYLINMDLEKELLYITEGETIDE